VGFILDRDRLIAVNPVEGVQLPKNRRKAGDQLTIAMDQLTLQLLPAVPDRYRALVALAGGTGLRWGECVGLRWNAVLPDAVLVERVAIEVSGHVSAKPYPKSTAGRREVPLPQLVQQHPAWHRDRYGTGPHGEVFTNEAGTPPRRMLFRSRIWRPSLVRAGLLGDVRQVDNERWLATWSIASGAAMTNHHETYGQAIRAVAAKAHGGLRFHDLRHSYASWLITSGVPIADAQKVMGHESPQTLLAIYTHVQNGARDRIIGALAAFSLPLEPESELPTTRKDSKYPLTRGGMRVGLSGLEPLTSALSGQRSNRLSYRPAGAPRRHR
jgi:integrase